MNLNNIINSNKRQFTNTMKKEGMVVSDYYDTSKTYTVFFRRNNRSTSPEGKLRLFYEQDTDIKIGTVFVLRDIPYVVVSQDGIESDVYYTSMAIRCDTYFTVYSNTAKGYMKIPFVTMTDKYTISSNSTISIISGTVVVYTGLNDHVKDMSVGNGYYNYGGYYKVGNYFYNNNIAYIYLTREAMSTEDEYILSYKGEVTFKLSLMDKYQLSYDAVYNGTIVENPMLTYVSSDTSVATVDDNGLVTFHGVGTTTITATWTDGNNTTCDTTIFIFSGEDTGGDSGEEGGDAPTPTPTPSAIMAFENSHTTVKYGFARTIKVKYIDANTAADVTDKFDTVFTISDATFDTSLLTVTDEGNQVKLFFEDDNNFGETFVLNAVDSNGTCKPISRKMTLEQLVV